MGTNVLDTHVSGSLAPATEKTTRSPWLRAYAHCAHGRTDGAVSIVLVNSNNESSLAVNTSFQFTKLPNEVEVWMLTPKGGNHWGHAMLLNGVELLIIEDGGGDIDSEETSLSWRLPSLNGTMMSTSDALVIEAGSYAFLRFADANANACLSDPAPVPPPTPPPPSPTPTPPTPSPPGPPLPASCLAALAQLCPGEEGKGANCEACISGTDGALKTAGCYASRGENAFKKLWCDAN